MTRLRLALAGALVALVCLPVAGADAAWSAKQQIKGQLGTSSPVIGVDETGTMAVGFVGTGSPPATYVERPPGLAEWNSAGVTITKITGSASNTNFALSSSGAAVAAWTIGGFGTEVPWAAYKPPGKPWGAATQLDNLVSFGPVIPLINEAGQAAVVWARRPAGSTAVIKSMPEEIVYAAPTATAWPAASKIANITVPVPNDQDPEEGIDYNRCGEDLHAAMLPNGTPVVSWNDDYGSYKQSGGVNDGYEIALCSVRAAAGSGVVDVTSRAGGAWYAAPAANMQSWTQTSLVSSPTDTDTAILLRGLGDSLKFTGCSEVDACASQERETRLAVGSSSSLGMGTLLGIKEIAAVALRNDRTLLVTDSSSSLLRAGVGAGVPTPSALPEDFQLLSAGLALSDSGAAHIGAVPNNLTVFGLHLFDAPAAGAFAAQAPQVETSSGANKAPSLALDCEGKPVMAWVLSSTQLWSSTFDGAPSVCGDGPDPEPEPETPKPGGGGTPGGPTVITTPPPVPSRLATVGAPKTDGSNVTFQITCSPVTVNACAGKTVITQSNGGGKKSRASAKSAGVKIGSVSFSGLKPGAKKTLKVPLVASAKQALKAGKSIKATITVTVKDGAGNVRVTTRSATLKKSPR